MDPIVPEDHEGIFSRAAQGFMSDTQRYRGGNPRQPWGTTSGIVRRRQGSHARIKRWGNRTHRDNGAIEKGGLRYSDK
jgi:hypothetical protein